MTRENFEKLGSIFLVTFSIGLAIVLYADGMERAQWFGCLLAVFASMTLAITVRVWPRGAPAKSSDEA